MQRTTVQYLSISLFLLLLLWGIYSLLVYLGIPVHGAVMLSNEAIESLNSACGSESFACRGMHAFFPFLWNTITRVPVFAWYGILSALLYGMYVGVHYLKTSEWVFRILMKPWKVLLLFVGFTWLLFTCISYVSTDGVSVRRLVEPLPQVYTNAGPEAIEVLRENFDALNDRGCLRYQREFGNGAAQYHYKSWCIQTSFFTRVLTPLLFILVFLFELLIAGRFVFSLLRLKAHSKLVETAVSLGLGICTWIVLLWIIAIAGIYISGVGWALAVIIPAICYKQVLYYWHAFRHAEWEVHLPVVSATSILFWLLLSYLALNFINVVRPFPIGWDDLGSYLNRPHLLVSYGEFVFSMASFQWEYLTSLGFLLFGFDSWFGATTSMLINWSAGLIAVFFTYAFARTFLGKNRGLLSAVLYYILPVVGHFSFADMKIDNAVFGMGVLATFLLFLHLFYKEPAEDGSEISPYRSFLWAFLAGVFAGFAFGMKVTAIMIFMGLGVVALGASLHVLAGVGALFMSVAIFSFQNVLNLEDLLSRVHLPPDSLSQNGFGVLCLVIGAAFVAAGGWRRRSQVRSSLLMAAIFAAGFALFIFPWTQHNVFLSGEILPRPFFNAPNTLSPEFVLDGTPGKHEAIRPRKILPPELVVDESNPACSPSGGDEELGRYWGFRQGWGHYLTLPWRTVMNIDSVGYYVTTMPALLLFPLLLLVPFFWMSGARWMRWLWVATMFMVVQWIFLANGVPWYGIGMFMGLCILLEALLAKSPDLPNKIVTSVLLTLSILICLAMRFWQFELQKNLFEYPLGKITAEALRERTIPHYDDITDIIMQRHEAMPDRPYVYRVGTFIPYFVPKNLEVIGLADHQLDFFNCLYNERDPQLTLARLKAMGFNSVIFDTNTATIEKDPNGSLHQKVNAFTDFLNNPEMGFQVVINDNGAGVAYLLIP